MNEESGGNSCDPTDTMKQRRAHFLILIVAAVICGLIGLGAYSDAISTGRTIGLALSTDEGHPRITDIYSNTPAERSELKVDDILLAMNGEKRSTTDAFIAISRHFRRGVPVDFTVRRMGRTLTFSVTPGVPFPWSVFLLNLLTALGYLLVGLLAHYRAPEGERAQVLTFFSLAVALEMALPDQLVFMPQWAVFRLTIFYVLTGIQMGLEFHLASIIPRRYPWFDERPRLLKSYYVFGLGIGILTSTVLVLNRLGVSDLDFLSGFLSTLLNDVVLIAWGLGIMAILIVQLRQSRTRAARNQTLLILAGVLPWTLFNIVTTVVTYLGMPRPGFFDVLQPLVLLVYPILIFIAIFRYHMLDVQLVIRRSLVLFIVTAIVILLFSLIFETGASRFGSEINAGRLQVGIFAIGMLLLGLAFNPIRNWIQVRVDRQFFPERFETRDRLAELAATLPSLGSLTEIGNRLIEEICEIFRLESATLLVSDPHSGLLVSLASNGGSVTDEYGISLLLDSRDPGVQLIREARRVLPADLIAESSPGLAQRIQAVNAEMGVGLVNADTLVGILLLGPTITGERLIPEELDLLRLFSLNLATVLENIRLFESTRYEQLTGLLRREAVLRALEEEMERSARYERPLAVGMIDLDYFKRVNDSWGHLAGDTILQRVAQCLQAQLRTTDRIGRYGGEEFLFFLPETDLVAGLHVAEKLRQAVSQLDFQLPEAPELRVTISIGIAELGTQEFGEHSLNELINAADQALLQAKREGRNRVIAA